MRWVIILMLAPPWHVLAERREPVPLLRDLGVVKRLFAVDRIRVWLIRQLFQTMSIVLWVVVRVRSVRALVFEFSSPVFECVTASRLRHRPTRHSFFIAQENHSNTKHTQTLRKTLTPTLEHRYVRFRRTSDVYVFLWFGSNVGLCGKFLFCFQLSSRYDRIELFHGCSSYDKNHDSVCCIL